MNWRSKRYRHWEVGKFHPYFSAFSVLAVIPFYLQWDLSWVLSSFASSSGPWFPSYDFHCPQAIPAICNSNFFFWSKEGHLPWPLCHRWGTCPTPIDCSTPTSGNKGLCCHCPSLLSMKTLTTGIAFHHHLISQPARGQDPMGRVTKRQQEAGGSSKYESSFVATPNYSGTSEELLFVSMPRRAPSRNCHG